MNVTLSVETAGQRADQFLAARLDGLTRSAPCPLPGPAPEKE